MARCSTNTNTQAHTHWRDHLENLALGTIVKYIQARFFLSISVIFWTPQIWQSLGKAQTHALTKGINVNLLWVYIIYFEVMIRIFLSWHYKWTLISTWAPWLQRHYHSQGKTCWGCHSYIDLLWLSDFSRTQNNYNFFSTKTWSQGKSKPPDHRFLAGNVVNGWGVMPVQCNLTCSLHLDNFTAIKALFPAPVPPIAYLLHRGNTSKLSPANTAYR